MDKQLNMAGYGRVDIIPVNSRPLLRKFIGFPYTLYRNHPQWVAPLRMLEKRHLDPRRNLFLQKNEHQFFLAGRYGRIVGRISAHANQDHERIYGDACGFLGFFDSINNRSVANALFNAAGDWHRKRGMNSLAGPVSFTINESAGLLIDGYSHRPALLMPWHPPYYRDLWENYGFLETERHLAFTFNRDVPLHPLVHKIADTAARTPGLTIRKFSKKDFDSDLRQAYDVYCNAWKKDWANYAPDWDEFYRQASFFKFISHPDFVWMALLHDRPVGVGLAVPDINEILGAGRGRLWPWTVWKLWRFIRHPRSLRILVLELDSSFLDSGIDALIYRTIHRESMRLGLREGEVSWLRDTNENMLKLLDRSGGVVNKRYALYRIPLT